VAAGRRLLYLVKTFDTKFETIVIKSTTKSGIANGIYSVSFLHRQSRLLYEHGESWPKEMDCVVEKFHANGFVHGDLRLPNIIVCGDKLYLVNFDWGGKEGDATLPDVRLCPIFTRGPR
jgi:tRNA A-37 threonylcarbamoyl transferase component Bud32